MTSITASTSELRGALIGCGFFAQNHLHSWKEIEGVRLVAVCDQDLNKARRAGTEFNVPGVYGDAAEMFEHEQLDFVDIATTMPSHRALVELAAKHRVPVIVQKPFAPTWSDCVAMVNACEKAKVPLMVHENFRFQAPMMAVQKALQSGVIGTPISARISFRTGYDIYAGQPYLAHEERFILLDLGIHLLDIARVFLGEVQTVQCQTQSVKPGLRGEDMATVLLRHAAGATSVVDCSYASKLSPDLFPQTLVSIEGTRGSVVLRQDFQLVVMSDGQAHTEDVSTPLLSWTSQPWHVAQQSVLNTQKHWIDCLRSGAEPATSGADNLKTYALVDAAYESALHQSTVRPAHRP
jgi:predicted dehydrogenase